MLAPLVLVGLGLAAAEPTQQRVRQQGATTVETVRYQGYDGCLRVANGDVELIATTAIGPRILSYRLLPDGKNVLNEEAASLGGKSGEPGWVGRGGHRLWVGPEDTTRTYAPDNGPIAHEVHPDGVTLTQPVDAYGIVKAIRIQLPTQGTRVKLLHTITNAGTGPTQLAPWALTVMNPGGVEVIPLPPAAPHPGPPENASGPEAYAPAAGLVLWPYFSFADDRWAFGERFITLTQKDRGPTKLGYAGDLRWVGYLNAGAVFVKWLAPYQAESKYPDRGAVYETFSNPGMVEMETLGPIVSLDPGASTEHVETWELFRAPADLPTDQGPDALGRAVADRVVFSAR
jgi:hypothetical protein